MFSCLKPGIVLTVVSLFLSIFHVSYAELEGMWTAEHPELGGVFFRIKSDSSCTYFLEEGTQTTIHKGVIEEIPTGFKLVFENGVTFSIGELQPGYVDIRMDMAKGHDVSASIVVAQAGLINSQSIGRMTVNADDEEEDEERLGYFGAWEGELISGKKIYFVFNEDRTAGCTHSFSGPEEADELKQVVGYWKKDGEKMQIVWNDGSFTVIETNGRRIEQTTFKSGELLENAKGLTSRILPIRIKDLPQEWHEAFKKDYVARMPIIVMRQVQVLKRFFRGEWIVGREADPADFRSIQLKRFGKAYTNRYGGVKGEWYPGSDSVSVVWQNGVREVLSAVGNQFMVKSYNPDQPVSGRAAKIEPINAVDEDKLGYYLNRKKELLDPKRFMRSLQKAYKKNAGKQNKKED